MSKIVKLMLVAVSFAFVVACAHDRPATGDTVPVKVVKHHKCHNCHKKCHHHHCKEKVPVNYEKDTAK